MTPQLVEYSRLYKEGDIHDSYSGDRIANRQPLRKPFEHLGELWITVGMHSNRAIPGFAIMECEAYKIVILSAYKGKAQTYTQLTARENNGRNSEKGFYHSMIVKHRGKDYVLVGPRVLFRAGYKVEQASLF